MRVAHSNHQGAVALKLAKDVAPPHATVDNDSMVDGAMTVMLCAGCAAYRCAVWREHDSTGLPFCWALPATATPGCGTRTCCAAAAGCRPAAAVRSRRDRIFDCDALYDGCCTTLHRPAVPQDGAVPPLPSAAVPLLLGSGYR